MSTTISTLDENGRAERTVEVDEIDTVCPTCQGTGIDPDPADMEPGKDKCPECDGAGRIEPVPPTGMGQPPIDHDKVTAAAEALNGAAFTREQAAAVKTLYRIMESIREDRQALNDRKADAKANFQAEFPDADIASIMVAYNIYIAAETEAGAAAQMRRVAATVKDVADMYQPTLF